MGAYFGDNWLFIGFVWAFDFGVPWGRERLKMREIEAMLSVDQIVDFYCYVIKLYDSYTSVY